MGLWLTNGPQLAPARAGDVQVNTYTTGSQGDPSVAANLDGDLVVVWRSRGSHGTDTNFASIQGQRYAADGTALGSEFQVNTYTTDNQFNPSVAMDLDGDFVVVWDSGSSGGPDTSGRSIQGQRYAADGSPAGEEFQVNAHTPGIQSDPVVAMDAAGNYVVTWFSQTSVGSDNGYSIQGQRFAADGSSLGAQFQVNTYTTNSQRTPSVAMASGGDFVVVWRSGPFFLSKAGGDPSGGSIRGRRFAADGSPMGDDFQVNSYTLDEQDEPAVAMTPGGAFIVVWESEESGGTDTPGRSVQGRRFAADGSPIGDDFQVNVYTTSNQSQPNVAMGAAGDFVVVWDSFGSSGTDMDRFSVQSRRYAADGSPASDELQVNCYTTSIQDRASVVLDAAGDFVVVWASGGSYGNDQSIGIQRTSGTPTVEPDLVTIPTLNDWGLRLFIGLLALMAVRRMRSG